MAGEPVRYERRERVGILRLDRPEVHNVVDAAVVGRLEAHLDRLEGESELRVLVLTGTGSRTFCAGSDLSYIADLGDPAEGLAVARRMRAVLERLVDGPRPVVAAVNGDAWGGGCEILTACHLRIAAASARFGFRQAAMGVTTGWGGGARLFRLLGCSRALRLLLTADTVDAPEALRLGLVDRVVPPEDLVAETLATAGRIAAHAPAAVRAFLELARAAAREPATELVRLEERLFDGLWDGEPFRRRVAEWREHRSKPHGSEDPCNRGKAG